MNVDLDRVRVGTKFTKKSQMFSQDNKKCFPVWLDCEITKIGYNDQVKTYVYTVNQQHPKLIDNQRITGGGSIFSKYFMDMWLSVEY